MKNTDYETLYFYEAAFYSLCGITPRLKTLPNGQISFRFDFSDISEHLRKFNSNVSLPVQDYIRHLKQLKARMLSLRGVAR